MKVDVKVRQQLRCQYLSGSWVVIWEDGYIVEHSIPTQEQAEQRLAFHAERVNAQRAWDDAHRGL